MDHSKEKSQGSEYRVWGQEKEAPALLTGVSGRERNIIPLDIFNCGCLKEKYQKAFGDIKEVLEKEVSTGERDWVGVML